jgi:hypothetical protein
MSDVSTAVENNLPITRDIRYIKTYKRKHAHLFVRNNTLLLHKTNRSHTLNQE